MKQTHHAYFPLKNSDKKIAEKRLAYLLHVCHYIHETFVTNNGISETWLVRLNCTLSFAPMSIKSVGKTWDLSSLQARTMDTQWRNKSKISEKLGQCDRQNMLRPYLKIWDWDWIFSRVVKAISSLGVRSPCNHPYVTSAHF